MGLPLSLRRRPYRTVGQRKKASGKCPTPSKYIDQIRLRSIVATLRRSEALDAAQQFVLAEGVERVAIGIGVGVDQRGGVPLGLVHLDILLQEG